MNEKERELVVKKVANHIIEDLMYEPLPPLDLKAAALEITTEMIGEDLVDVEYIAGLAVTDVMNDDRVTATKTPRGNIMWFERKGG